MNREEDDNYISVGGWMLMMLITAIPLIGFIMMIVWCFYGNNQTRKNYYRAIFAWIFLALGVFILLALFGEPLSHFLKQLSTQRKS